MDWGNSSCSWIELREQEYFELCTLNFELCTFVSSNLLIRCAACAAIRTKYKDQRTLSCRLLPAAWPPCLVPLRVRTFDYFKAGLLHRFKPTQHRSRVIQTFCFEISHRTGASMFARSRTVGNNRLIPRQFIHVSRNFSIGNLTSPFDMTFLVSRFSSHINNDRAIAGHLGL